MHWVLSFRSRRRGGPIIESIDRNGNLPRLFNEPSRVNRFVGLMPSQKLGDSDDGLLQNQSFQSKRYGGHPGFFGTIRSKTNPSDVPGRTVSFFGEHRIGGKSPQFSQIVTGCRTFDLNTRISATTVRK